MLRALVSKMLLELLITKVVDGVLLNFQNKFLAFFYFERDIEWFRNNLSHLLNNEILAHKLR